MKKLLKLSVLALFTAAFGFALGFAAGPVLAHEGEDHSGEAVAQAEDEEQRGEEENDQESGTPFSYTAQAGDSFTKIARKAVQTYGINNDVELSGAQIVAAETFLTSEAGFPMINEGEKVELREDSVKAAVEKADGLDEAAEARWERYVPYVDFNTDNIGEARD